MQIPPGLRSLWLRPATLLLPAAILLLAAVPGPASAAPKEVYLATAAQALSYCQSGKMPAGDVAYIAGAGGLAQYGSGAGCKQAVPTGKVAKAIEAAGHRVKECNMVKAKQALALCNAGDIGTYDIDYIAGKVGETLSGPGYGCVINSSTSGIGTTICK